jgi:thioredoxin reductase
MKSQSQVSTRKTHEVIVIGGGSAGYAAARTARDADTDVAISLELRAKNFRAKRS